MKALYLIVLVLFAINCENQKSTELPAEKNPAKHAGPAETQTYNYKDVVIGEVIYVPVYSEIFSYDQKKTLNLTTTLSIHNIDLEHPIKVIKVDYYNGKGQFIRSYLTGNVILKPLETTHFIVEQDDKSGGTGANFIVEWVSEYEVVSPITEAVMISAASQLGISFVTSGKVIQETGHRVSTEEN